MLLKQVIKINFYFHIYIMLNLILNNFKQHNHNQYKDVVEQVD